MTQNPTAHKPCTPGCKADREAVGGHSRECVTAAYLTQRDDPDARLRSLGLR